MNNEYIIIDKTAIQKRIEELEKYNERFKHAKTRSPYGIPVNPTVAAWEATLSTLKQILSQSTPLIPEIDKAIEFGKDIRSEKSFINNNFGSPFLDYEDSTEETINYISNLKLDI